MQTMQTDSEGRTESTLELVEASGGKRHMHTSQPFSLFSSQSLDVIRSHSKSQTTDQIVIEIESVLLLLFIRHTTYTPRDQKEHQQQ